MTTNIIAPPDSGARLLDDLLARRRLAWEDSEIARFERVGQVLPRGWQQRYLEPVGPDLTDVPELPGGWTIASVDQLTTAVTSGSRDWSKYYEQGTGTFILAQNIRPGRLDLTRRQAVGPPEDDRDRARSRVIPGDLLVTIVGNAGDICRVASDLPEHYVSQSVALLRPVEASMSEYLEYYLLAPSGGQRQYRRYMYGAGRAHLSFDQLKMTPVLLPPLDEQRRIVAALDATLGRLDAARARLARVPEILKRYRAALLKAACEGRLVPTEAELARAEGRDFEPAEALLARILVERRAKWEEAELAKYAGAGKPPPASWRTKYKEPAPPDAEDLPELPEGWCLATVDCLLREPLANGRSVRDAAGGFPVLRLSALKDGRVDPTERKPGDWSRAEAEPYLIQRDDFLIARGNGSLALVGRGALVENEPDPVAHPDTLIRVRTTPPAVCRDTYELRGIRIAIAVGSKPQRGPPPGSSRLIRKTFAKR